MNGSRLPLRLLLLLPLPLLVIIAGTRSPVLLCSRDVAGVDVAPYRRTRRLVGLLSPMSSSQLTARRRPNDPGESPASRSGSRSCRFGRMNSSRGEELISRTRYDGTKKRRRKEEQGHGQLEAHGAVE